MDIIRHNSGLYRYGGIRSRRIVPAALRSVFPSRRCLIVCVWLLVAAAILRWVALGQVPLVPEEAYYWLYSQHPDLSYFDHPPMVAGMIGLGTTLFGNTEFGVRIVGNLLMIGTSILMYFFGRAWFDATTGLLAALMLHILPVYFGAGFIATMDPALLLFWMLCLNGITLALRRNRTGGWYLAGIALGGALLSKYTGIFLVPGALLALSLHAPWRRHLRTPHPYLACLIALTMFTPVILWNARHHWASFHYQLMGRSDAASMSFATVLESIGFQIVVATPAIFWGVAASVRRIHRKGYRRITPAHIVAMVFSLPLIAVVIYKSIRGDSRINWTLPAYLSLMPAASRYFLALLRKGVRDRAAHRAFRPLLWTVMICMILNITMLGFLLGLQPFLHWISAFGPWEQLAEIVEYHEDKLESDIGMEPLVIAEGKNRLASVLAFYRYPFEDDTNTARTTTSQWILGGSSLAFPYWHTAEQWVGHTCLYIDKNPQSLHEKLLPYFDSIELVNDPRLDSLGGDRYYLAIARNYHIPGSDYSFHRRDQMAYPDWYPRSGSD